MDGFLSPAPPDTLHSEAMSFRMDFCGGLDLADSLLQSGIYDDGLDHSWADEPRLQNALQLSIGYHDGKLRRHGGKVRGIHQVWVGHRVKNDQNVQRWLFRNGLSPSFGVYCAILHDIIEDARDLSVIKGLPFAPEPLIDFACRLWGDESVDNRIREVLVFATDAPGLKGKARIRVQRRKSFNPNDTCTSNPLFQAIRLYDKLSHVHFDAEACDRDLVDRKDAFECFKQGLQKSFVLDFPIAVPRIEKEYVSCMRRIAASMSFSAQRHLGALMRRRKFSGQPPRQLGDIHRQQALFTAKLCVPPAVSRPMTVRYGTRPLRTLRVGR